ncbi:putative SAM-dependent methyltransferase [Saprospira grandis str. Lewin]|uniref:SAM-dependent methyltransferase n=2 Tax=Saprospira TaxID=1007 RepID=H6KZK5_SAPGL|nr:class I SAM-dependent rRNA methyltransferase [Saprospira grandis]AFC25781.1 putative SAM-dependent methyltransferase [Saprospira grandis str. Lewin]
MKQNSNKQLMNKLYYPKVFIKPGKESAILRKHPWLFSGAIKRIEGQVEDGDIVSLHRSNGEFLAIGHYHHGSIAVRVFSYEPLAPDADFWAQKFNRAWKVRQIEGLDQDPKTNCFRLLHGEGDGLPGLIIDFYAGTAVFQAHSIGMHRCRNEIVEALKRCLGDKLQAVYDKSKASLPALYAQELEDGLLYGERESGLAEVLENGHKFEVNWITGQKTGFFLDQRENRALLGRYAEGKTVLNAFCYSGGFSIYALKAGAKRVDSVDVSAKAIDLLNKNVEINGLEGETHRAYTQDVLKFLQQSEEKYEVMVLDPPAYAKSLKKRHKAVQGYKRLNIEGFKKVAPGGLLFTFSCSQVVDEQLFYNTITSAAIEAGRQVRVLRRLSQPADHPVSMFHPEGSYLKGLLLHVE